MYAQKTWTLYPTPQKSLDSLSKAGAVVFYTTDV